MPRSLVVAGIAAALVAALFFNGIALPFFSTSLAGLVVAWWVAVRSNPERVHNVASSGVSWALLIFWAWLGLSILWSAVPYASALNFWWLGALPLAFLAYSLAVPQEGLWPRLAAVVLLVALALATLAFYQLVVLGTEPQATFLNRQSLAAFFLLVLLPLFGSFLGWPAESVQGRRLLWMLGGVALLLCAAFTMLRGRGATLTGLTALVLLLAVAWKRVAPRRLLALAGIIATAVLVANIVLGGTVGERLATMSDPAGAGATRTIIWRAAWQMFLAAPWFGTGIGTFWMLWPPYRHPADDSGGYYAHNDYLQLSIETGIIGLALLLAVYAMVARQYLRASRNPALSGADRLEITGLFAGLLAVAAHSFVDFNLYILPILIVAGLALGRLHELCVPYHAAAGRAPANPRRLRLLANLLAVLLMAYFGALAASAVLTERARVLVEAGDMREADRALVWAEGLAPGLDVPLVMHASLLARVLDQLPADFPPDSRRAVFEDAKALLEDAERANRYRANIHYTRARLLHRHGAKIESSLAERAPESYRMALARDPRFHWARVGLAEWMMEAGREHEARGVLEAGMAHWYPPSRDTAIYYAFTARLRRAQGDEPGARDLEERVREMARVHGSSAEEILRAVPTASSVPIAGP